MSLNPKSIRSLGIIVFVIASLLIGKFVSFLLVMYSWAIILSIFTLKSKYPTYKLQDVSYIVVLFAISVFSHLPESATVNTIMIIITIIHIYLVFNNKEIKFNISNLI